MTVYVIYITFIIFVILLILVCLYFLILLRYQKVQSKKINEMVANIRDIMERHLSYEKLNHIPKEELEYLKKIASNKIGLQGLLICFKDYVEKNGFHEKAREYANEIVSYQTLLNNRIVRNKYRQSYILYLLAEFGINTEEVKEFAINSLNKRSIYVRNNALRVIQNASSVPLVLEALDVIDNNEYYFNDRILVDFLDGFMGNRISLNRHLLNNMDKYSNRVKRLIIEYFFNNHVDDQDIKLKILHYLSNSEDKELLIASTKYFGKISDDRAITYILNHLNSSHWELRAISAKVLGKYKREDVKLKLLESLTDKNYTVRYNSVFSYMDMEEENALMNSVNNMEDVFAKQMLVYAMQSRNIISFEDYPVILEGLEEGVSLEW